MHGLDGCGLDAHGHNGLDGCGLEGVDGCGHDRLGGPDGHDGLDGHELKRRLCGPRVLLDPTVDRLNLWR